MIINELLKEVLSFMRELVIFSFSRSKRKRVQQKVARLTLALMIAVLVMFYTVENALTIAAQNERCRRTMAEIVKEMDSQKQDGDKDTTSSSLFLARINELEVQLRLALENNAVLKRELLLKEQRSQVTDIPATLPITPNRLKDYLKEEL